MKRAGQKVRVQSRGAQSGTCVRYSIWIQEEFLSVSLYWVEGLSDALTLLLADPDRSNPTRARLERPLDTIRSFEAAVDRSYNRRASQCGDFALGPAGMNTPDMQSRRSSWMPSE